VCSQSFSDPALASAFAVGGSVLAMLLLRCLHPPGAATALAPVLGGPSITSLNFEFVYMPVGLNVAVMLIIVIAINRWLLRYDYPIKVRKFGEKKSHGNTNGRPWRQTGISERDLEDALHNMDTFVDITSGDLGKLLDNAQKQSFKRTSGKISCADIMVSDLAIVEYGTEVEEAWRLMQRENLKALPVIDRSKRVIGIVTVNDFLKFSHADTNESYQEKFLAFIRRTPNVYTNKPESVGHIMSAPCTVLTESTHIAELVPWLSTDSHGQIPIVNTENRLVGMVYQANLIAALYPSLMLGQ
jgi:CBS domain-containing membrane protein